MEKWLSFIVPVYNVEDYLSECVDSLLNQDVPSELYEIILYDDGSTDGSLRIAQKYGADYANIRVFTHLNSGAAETRNEAIEKAVGKYIWFVDSDDFIAPGLLSRFYEKTRESHLDMLIFNNVAFEDGKCRRFVGFDVPESPIKTGIELYQDFYYNPVLTNRLILRDLLIKHRLRYIPGNKAEDCVLNPLCFYHANAVCSLPVDAYYYRMRSQSVSHHVDNRKEKGEFIGRERLALRSALERLPFRLSIDYAVLCLASLSPLLILDVQRFLRTMKRWIKR